MKLILLVLVITLLLTVGCKTMSDTVNDGAIYFDPYSGTVNSYSNNTWTPITDSVYPSPTAPGGTVQGTSTTSGPTAAQQAAQTQINSGLNQLPGQLNAGNQNILTSYNSAFSRLTGQQQADNQNLANQVSQAETGNETARDNIGAGVRNTNQSLQRLLGGRGSGNSSAASILAPFAAAQQGNIQRSQVQNAYGQNRNALTQAQNATDTGYSNSFGDLANQKQTQEQQLQAQIDQEKANLLSQEANPDTNQINSLLSAITQLGINPSFTPKAVSVAPTNLAQYNYTPTAAPQVQGGAVGDAAVQAAGPFWSLLNGQKKNQLAGA